MGASHPQTNKYLTKHFIKMKITTLENLKKELLILMQYGVPAENQEEAAALVDRYDDDRIAMNLFTAFYSYLPEAQDDAIESLRVLNQRQGNFLICASTLIDDYIYVVSPEQAEFLGTAGEGIWDEEILEFFGYSGREAFINSCRDLSQIEEYAPTPLNANLCPACSVSHGEYHTLGCPVEICPWCGGQFIHCQCRFTKLKVNEFSSGSKIDELRSILEQQGRVPYDAEKHRPDYPSANSLKPNEKS